MSVNDNTRAFKKRVYDLTLKLIGLLDSLNKSDMLSRRLGDQLLRSGTSVLANYVEACSASSKNEFARYLNISLRSSNESKLWLCLLRDSGRLKRTDVKFFLDEFGEYSKIFASSLITIKKEKQEQKQKVK